jgi:hypothetical protein
MEDASLNKLQNNSPVTINKHLKSEVHAAVLMKIAVFWEMMSSRLAHNVPVFWRSLLPRFSGQQKKRVSTLKMKVIRSCKVLVCIQHEYGCI